MAENDLGARLRVFATLLRYGHELFACDGLEMASASAVNNAHELVPYATSSLFECTDGKVRIIAQYGQPVVNRHSALAVEQIARVREFLKDPEFVSADGAVRLVHLTLPAQATKSKLDFVWLIDFGEQPPPAGVDEIIKLMGASAGTALSFHRLCRARRKHVFRRIGKSTFWSLIGLACVAALFIRVPESTTSEFFVRAPEETSVYAWFDGAIAACEKKDGESVKAGEVVVKYDISQLKYRIAIARNQLAETEAELALARQNAFTHPEDLGKVKLLEVHCKGLKVSVDEAQWYIDHSEVKAPADGVVALAEGEAARLENKAVRTGDILFRVLGGSGYEAEIPVSEREASVLRGDMEVSLFLHTAPEKEIKAEILEVSHYPQLNEQKSWVYRVRVAMDPASVPVNLRYGMRGVAKLKSGMVTLGYRLFKSAVLYLRGL